MDGKTYASESLEAAVVALYCLHAMAPGIPPVAVHLKGDMLRDGPLLEGTNEQFSKLLEGPFSWRRLED